jgi:arylsulfatase A-like enzyme
MSIDPTMKLAGDIRLREGMTVKRIRTERPQDDWVPLMRDDMVIEYPCDQSTLTQRYTQEAVKFIKANRARPFFLYLPHTMPHIPLFVSDKFKDTSERGLYGDVIEEIDWGVGEILNVLKELKLDERTLVVYTSDNGPWDLGGGRGGSAGPLRGYKFQTYEGGMREPCIMRWPGKIPADTVSFEVAATIDLLPTIARLAGARVPDDRVIDGKDIWPLMNGTPDARTPHDAYFYYQGNQLEAVRCGNWKLRRVGVAALNDVQENISDSRDLAKSHPDIYRGLLDAIDNLDAAELHSAQEKASQLKDLAPQHRELIRRVVDKFSNVNEVQLFNLQQDVSETRNLADRHPDIVRHLIDTMNSFDRDLKAHTRPAAQWEEK